MNPKADLKTLGLEARANAAAIKARYRELALEHHPDRGGDPAKFQAINESYERLKNRKCLACKGSGSTTKQRGFTVTKVLCTECNGKGV